MTYGERLRSIQPHVSVYATRTKKRYYDDGALTDQLGSPAKDRKAKMLDDTDGIGYVKRIGKELYHRDRKTKQVERLSAKQARFFASQDG